jgi:hypothetical protein
MTLKPGFCFLPRFSSLDMESAIALPMASKKPICAFCGSYVSWLLGGASEGIEHLGGSTCMAVRRAARG